MDVHVFFSEPLLFFILLGLLIITNIVAIVIVDSCYNSQGLVKQVWGMVEILYSTLILQS